MRLLRAAGSIGDFDGATSTRAQRWLKFSVAWLLGSLAHLVTTGVTESSQGPAAWGLQRCPFCVFFYGRCREPQSTQKMRQSLAGPKAAQKRPRRGAAGGAALARPERRRRQRARARSQRGWRWKACEVVVAKDNPVRGGLSKLRARGPCCEPARSGAASAEAALRSCRRDAALAAAPCLPACERRGDAQSESSGEKRPSP